MTRSTNSDFYFPHHLTILSLSQLFLTHKGVRVIGSVYTSGCTAGKTWPDLPQVELSRMVLDRELR